MVLQRGERARTNVPKRLMCLLRENVVGLAEELCLRLLLVGLVEIGLGVERCLEKRPDRLLPLREEHLVSPMLVVERALQCLLMQLERLVLLVLVLLAFLLLLLKRGKRSRRHEQRFLERCILGVHLVESNRDEKLW